MILSRIADAIRQQNWFTVVIEVLVVVVGIFIGLQVDDWNERRKDRADEGFYLARLHDDVELALSLSDRVRQRRLDTIHDLVSAADVVFGRNSRNTLTAAECEAIGVVRFFNIVVSDLPAVTELVSAGRLDILQDAELRFAIIELQQRAEALQELIPIQTIVRVDLPTEYPELIQSEGYFDEALDEIQQRYTCDLDGMRRNQAFLNAFSLALDGYDAYLRDGLILWTRQMERVHEMLDARLGVVHPASSDRAPRNESGRY